MGITLNLKPWFIAGEGEREYIRFQSSDSSLVDNSEHKLRSRMSRPAQLAIGASYALGGLLISGDVKWHDSIQQFDMENTSKVYDYSTRQVVNYSLGLRWKFFENLALRSGLFTDFSPHVKDLRQHSVWQADAIDQYGFSANLSYQNKNIEYTFGGYYVGGWGIAWIPRSASMDQVAKSSHIITMLVGVNYSTN